MGSTGTLVPLPKSSFGIHRVSMADYVSHVKLLGFHSTLLRFSLSSCFMQARIEQRRWTTQMDDTDGRPLLDQSLNQI
jgi:hypothetical protein